LLLNLTFNSNLQLTSAATNSMHPSGNGQSQKPNYNPTPTEVLMYHTNRFCLCSSFRHRFTDHW